MSEELEPGDGIVTFVGWRDDNGEEKFQAIIEFPKGPPEYNASFVWDRLPVRIVPKGGTGE